MTKVTGSATGSVELTFWRKLGADPMLQQLPLALVVETAEAHDWDADKTRLALRMHCHEQALARLLGKNK